MSMMHLKIDQGAGRQSNGERRIHDPAYLVEQKSEEHEIQHRAEWSIACPREGVCEL